MSLAPEALRLTNGEKFPLAVEIEINHDCNRACAYCPNSRHSRTEQGVMEKELFNLLLGQLADLGYQGRVSFHFYNEPLLCPDLDSFAALTKRILPRCRIDLFTNGTLLDQDRLESLLRAGVDKFTVTRHVGADLSALEKALPALPPAERERIRLLSYKDLPLSNRGGLVKAGSRDLTPPLKAPCLIPSCVLVVTREGNVLPCYEDYLQRNAMGNIREHHLAEIWSSEKFRSFRRSLRAAERSAHPGCRDCNNSLVIT